MNTAANAILHFDVQFGDDVGFEGPVLLQILFGGSVNDVPDGEALDGFVLGAESAAVHADDGFDEASVVFVAAVVSSLYRHVWQII